MLRSMRVRLMLAFVAVVAVAVGIAEVVAERMATREFDSYVSRVDDAYVDTLAQNLADYYGEHASWQGVESVFTTLPQTPGHLQLQDSSGAVVGDTSPGRGPGGGGGPGGSPGGPAGTPRGPDPGGPAGANTPETDASVTPAAGMGGPSGSGEAVGTPTPAGPADGGSPSMRPNAGPSVTPSVTPTVRPSGPAESGGPASTPSAPGPDGPAGAGTGPSATPGVGQRSPAESGGSGGNGSAPGEESPRGSEGSGFSGEMGAMLLAGSAAGLGGRLSAEATPTPQVKQSIPIYANGQQVGTLVVLPQQGGLRMSASLGDRFFDRMRLALLLGGITALLVAFLFALFFVDGITRPLRRLADAARRVAAGDFSDRVHVTAPSEAAELAGSFNRMAEALERDKETRHRLLADIAHELRTPLSVIQGTAQGFLDGVIAPDQEHAAVIRDQSVLLGKLITDLRDLSLAEAGELRLERRALDLGHLARQAARAVQHRADERGIQMEVAVPAEVPPCLVDADRTLQVIGNLLDNAVRHTHRGGRVTLRVGEHEGGFVAVEIEDTGEGIPPEHLPHVFERFYRVDASRARSGGTGLGLAIVSQLARAQGGSVSVDSEPGRGSVFRVSFPVAPAEGDTRQGPAPGRPAARSDGR